MSHNNKASGQNTPEPKVSEGEMVSVWKELNTGRQLVDFTNRIEDIVQW